MMVGYIDLSSLNGTYSSSAERTFIIGIGVAAYVYLFFKRNWTPTSRKAFVNISKQSQCVTYGNDITLHAGVISSSPTSLIEWKRDDKTIKDSKKFNIENVDQSHSSLSIHCLDFDDSGKYLIYVTNAFGTTCDEIEINVEATDMIFISGPVVVLPSEAICLQTIYPQHTNSSNAEWYKTKDNTTTKLQFGAAGCSITTSKCQSIIQRIEMTSTRENEGAFQLSLGTTKSNIIDVRLDESGKFTTEKEGNCLRFFALQAVSLDALRIALNNRPGSFQTKWERFTNYCKMKKRELLTTTPSSSKDLDVTTIYAMIRNTTEIPGPSKGWGRAPGENDTQIADDIERVRLYQNKICHANSSEMTTVDFNESVLDLIGAIRRLSGNNKKMIKQICNILNMVLCKGKEFDNMMADLMIYRESTIRQCDLLMECEDDPIGNTISEDNQAILLTGRSKLYVGEKAMFTACIVPHISCLSKIIWQKSTKDGNFSTIDIRNGEYMGSSILLPSPELYIHFVRKEDEGTYRIVVDSFNKVVYNSIHLEINECDDPIGNTISKDSLSVSINDVIHKSIDVNAVSTAIPVWLSFDLFGKIRAIEITMNEPKKNVYHSYIQQLEFLNS